MTHLYQLNIWEILEVYIVNEIYWGDELKKFENAIV